MPSPLGIKPFFSFVTPPSFSPPFKKRGSFFSFPPWPSLVFFGFISLILYLLACTPIRDSPGLFALRIEHEGWRPFYWLYHSELPIVLLFYQLAIWFRCVGDSLFHFQLFFFTLEALAAFLFFYATIRQLSGPTTALSLFILSVMRWSWIETRTCYPSSEVIFYLFGTLCFWIYALHKQKTWAWIISALFMGAGLYGYQVFKLVPFLFIIYFLFEKWKHRQGKKVLPLPSFLLYGLMVLISSIPILQYDWQQKTLGQREENLFIGTTLLEQKSLKPLLDVGSGVALMFNRQGDPIARHNIPDHRMLDDMTGVLFILGLGLAFRRWKQPEGFYPLPAFWSCPWREFSQPI